MLILTHAWGPGADVLDPAAGGLDQRRRLVQGRTSRIARRLARPAGMAGSSGSASASVGRSAETSRGVGDTAPIGRRTASRSSKVSKLA